MKRFDSLEELERVCGAKCLALPLSWGATLSGVSAQRLRRLVRSGKLDSAVGFGTEFVFSDQLKTLVKSQPASPDGIGEPLTIPPSWKLTI